MVGNSYKESIVIDLSSSEDEHGVPTDVCQMTGYKGKCVVKEEGYINDFVKCASTSTAQLKPQSKAKIEIPVGVEQLVIDGKRKRSLNTLLLARPKKDRTRIRCPVVNLHSVMNNLTDPQKDLIKEMGFGSFIQMRIHDLPTQMGYWVLDNLDAEKCVLNVNGFSIKITRKTVHDIIGIPMGNIRINALSSTRRSDSVTSSWRRQFIGLQRIRIKDVLTHMVGKEGDGRLFKLNFLVLFVTIMAEGTQANTVNQKFLPCLTDMNKISEMDWCTYLLECMQSTRLQWKRNNHFNGPMTFLILLYLNSTISTIVPHEKLYPAIQVWTSSMMKDREKEELGIGGFGKLPVDKDMLDIDYDAEDNEPLENRMARMSQFKKLKNRITMAQRVVNDCVKTNSDQMESDEPRDENSMDSSEQREFIDDYYTKKLRKMNKEDRRDNDKLSRQDIVDQLQAKSIVASKTMFEICELIERGLIECPGDDYFTSLNILRQNFHPSSLVTLDNLSNNVDPNGTREVLHEVVENECAATADIRTGSDGSGGRLIDDQDESNDVSGDIDTIKVKTGLNIDDNKLDGDYGQGSEPQNPASLSCSEHVMANVGEGNSGKIESEFGDASNDIMKDKDSMFQAGKVGSESTRYYDGDNGKGGMDDAENGQFSLTQFYSDTQDLPTTPMIKQMCIEELKKSVPSVGIAAVRMFDLDVPSFDLGFNLTPEPKKGNEDNTPEPKKGNEDNKEDEEFEEVKSILLDFPTDCTCPEKMTTLDPEKSIDGNSEFKTPKVHIMKPSTSNADGKGSHVICMKETYDVEPVSRIYPRQEVERVRRCIKPSGVLLSPFIERVVTLGKEMEPLEKKVCGSIFSARFNEMDVVFRAGSEDGHRIVMESLFPGIEVDRGVIDMWSIVLNDEERLRSRDSMARVFCHTQMVTDSMPSDDMDSATKHFISNMLAILEHTTFSSLEHVDLVLFPIVEGNHSYLISINIRTPQFHIIDNRKSDEMDVKKRYGRVPFFIISNLCSYLASEDHLSTMKLMVVDPVILKMGWRTNMNIVDSGVFVMRHMETYQGNGMFDYKSVLKTEAVGHKEQLDELRLKYLAKIILSDLNLVRNDVKAEAEAYHSLPATEKRRLKREALNKIQGRLANRDWK